MPMTEPSLETRPAHPYVAIPARAAMAQLPQVIPQLFGEIFAWVGQRQPPQDGPPFVRYLVTDMERELEIEVGIPVATSVQGDGRVAAGELPAGQYLTAVHTGPYDRLTEATGSFLDWAKQHGIVWQTSRRGTDEVWAARLEYYPTDPQKEPDANKWETELAFLVAN
jgi:effector-binding domain-containing protein